LKKDEVKDRDKKDSHKKPYEETKRNNLMDWGVIDLAESVQPRKSPNE
jgi:hypothetical protein